jgi:hypothetical protein
MKSRMTMLGLAVTIFAGGLTSLLGAQGGRAGQAAPAQAQAPAEPTVPIIGIAQVTFRSSDLAKSRAYYNGVLGLPEAFTLKDGAGVTSAYSR